MRKWKNTSKYKYPHVLTDILIGVFMSMFYLMMALLLASCSNANDEFNTEDMRIQRSGNGSDGMPLLLQIHTADYSQSTRSAAKGIEGIPAGSMQLLCFDATKHFIGMAKEVSNTPSTSDGKNQTLKAVVPSATTTIHFLANAHLAADETWMGKSATELTRTWESRYDTHEHCVYAGCVSKNSIHEMQTFLQNNASSVSLLRDRAKITINIQDADIQKAELAVCNAMASGCIIPGDDPTKVNIPSDPSVRIQGSISEMSETVFAFEHPNHPGDYLRAVMRATHQDGTIRYHHICLENDQHEPYPILRNHEYRINLIKLGKDTGYASFEEARNGDASNNAFILVDDLIPEISDGEHSLLIDNGTSVIYNAGASIDQVITFTYQGESDRDASSFKTIWLENETLAPPTLNYDASTGKGEIHFQINPITDELKTAKLHLIDTKHGLSRTIHLFSITQFNFQPSFTSSLGENALGKQDGDTGELTLQVPPEYPEDLLPVEFKIASNDINPKDLGIEVSSTEEVDGSTEDSSIKPWNCWFVYQANTRGSHRIIIKNVRDAMVGTTGKFFVKAENFGKSQEITFTYQ